MKVISVKNVTPSQYKLKNSSMSLCYNGMLPCFFHGLSSFLVANTSKSLQIRFRVMRGLIMSSTNPIKKQKT